MREALEAIPGVEVGRRLYRWEERESAVNHNDKVQGGVPGMELMETFKIPYGEETGHLDLSLVGPLLGKDIVESISTLRSLYAKTEFPYLVGILLLQRSVLNISTLFFDTKDERQTRAAYDTYASLAARYGQAGLPDLPHEHPAHGSRRGHVRLQRPRPTAAERAAEGHARPERHPLARQAGHLAQGDAIATMIEVGSTPAPTFVETVRGSVEVARLGRALMHEHIFVLDPAALRSYGRSWGASYWDEEREIANAVAKLRRVREAGIETLVDPTVLGIGRYLPTIERVNAEVDLNIIVATGIFVFLELPLFFRLRSIEDLAAFFVRDIREGLDGTSVKAAFLKFAVEEHGLIADVPRVVQAIAVAHHQTGVPIMVHTNAEARTGVPALDALRREGVDPTRVVISHAGDSGDLDYLRSIADTGAVLGFDRLPGEHLRPFGARIETLVQLLAEGYADRIHLSHDGACFLDFVAGDAEVAQMGLEGDYLFISNAVVPALLEAGVTHEQIDEMMIVNPKRFFGP